MNGSWDGNILDAAMSSATPISLLYNIRDASDNWAGVVYSNETLVAPTDADERCEFVAISGGIITKDETEDDDNSPDEWWLSPEIEGLKTYEFYNVLWVEWIDGVAYRKGLGRIWKDVWNRRKTEAIHMGSYVAVLP